MKWTQIQCFYMGVKDSMICRLLRWKFLKFEVNEMERDNILGNKSFSIELFTPDSDNDLERYYQMGLELKCSQGPQGLYAFKIQGEFELLDAHCVSEQQLKQESMEQLYGILDEKIEELERALHCAIVKPALSNILGERGKKQCACCGSLLDNYIPLDPYYELQEQKYHVLDDFRSEMVNAQQYMCPVCGSSDRERAYAICMEKELEKDKHFRILDIAPSMALADFIRHTFPNAEYKTSDLFMPGVDYKMDIMHMDLISDESIDFFICSHVLEHVKNDIQAMKELKRILHPSGKGILVVPINLNSIGVDEDPSCTDEGERWRRFGQGDHVRRYSRRGFLNRLYQVGFSVKECDREYFGRELMKKNGLLDTSCVYIVSKKRDECCG